MNVDSLLAYAQGDTPAPLLLLGEAGGGQAALARQAAQQWSGQPVHDYAGRRIVMRRSEEDVELAFLLHELSLRAVERRAVVLEITGASLEVQNALLKTLEEPPVDTWLILLADRDYMVLPTVRSRCTIVQAVPLSFDELTDWATEQQLDLEGLDLALAGGNPGRLSWMNENRDALDALAEGRVAPLLAGLHAADDARSWLGQLLLLASQQQPGQQWVQARQLLSSGVRPELVLAYAFLV